MSSASAGSRSDNSGEKNFAQTEGDSCPTCSKTTDFGATSTVAAEAQQGDGPASASASASAVTEATARTSAVSTVIGQDYAAAACEFGAVAVGPYSAAAAGKTGVVAVGLGGAAATSDAANSSCVMVNKDAGEANMPPQPAPQPPVT